MEIWAPLSCMKRSLEEFPWLHFGALFTRGRFQYRTDDGEVAPLLNNPKRTKLFNSRVLHKWFVFLTFSISRLHMTLWKKAAAVRSKLWQKIRPSKSISSLPVKGPFFRKDDGEISDLNCVLRAARGAKILI